MAPEKSEKKRKRDSDRHERPSKKPALELLSLPPLAASLVEDNSELAPVIVTTPGVNLPRDVRLKPFIKPRDSTATTSTSGTTGNTRPSASSHRNKGIASSEILLQSSDHPKLDFLGREAEDETDAQLKHYIAVVDPEKKTWQFVEVRKVTLRGGIRNTRLGVQDGEDEESQTIRAQRTALTNTFGTKKSRKAAQSLAENAQLSNAPLGIATAAESAILSSMPADAAADIATKAAAVQAEVQAAKPVPVPNLAATHPSDVYPIETLVPGGVSTLRQLPGVQEWRDAILAGSSVDTSSRYVSHRVESVVKSGNIQQVQILRFILLMLEFVRALRSKGAGGKGNDTVPLGSKRLPPREDLRRILSSTTAGAQDDDNSSSGTGSIPDSIIDAIRRKFAPQGSYLTKNDITLIHTTVCALSLHIPPKPQKTQATTTSTGAGVGGNAPNELATDPADLRDDLRLDAATIQQYFREIGCRYDKPRESEFEKWRVRGGKAEANQRRIARLRLPLMFPKVSRGGGGGGRR